MGHIADDGRLLLHYIPAAAEACCALYVCQRCYCILHGELKANAGKHFCCGEHCLYIVLLVIAQQVGLYSVHFTVGVVYCFVVLVMAIFAGAHHAPQGLGIIDRAALMY